MAIQGAYVGLSLAVQVGGAVGMRRRLLLAGAAISLAVAIWAMHFVGMLAARLPFPVDYLVFPTLLSFLVCVIVVGAAVLRRQRRARCGGALARGRGLHGRRHRHHALHRHDGAARQRPHGARAAVRDRQRRRGHRGSGLALWLAGGRGGRPPLLLSATALGIAIAGMHYTAMAGLTLMPHRARASGAPALSTDLLAIVVAIVAFIVSGIFLLTLVPDRSGSDRGPAHGRRCPPRRSTAAGATPGDRPRAGHAMRRSAGLGGPPRRAAKQLPVERDGGTQFVPVDDIVAVHANAHYTYIFDGQVEAVLPAGHRRWSSRGWTAAASSASTAATSSISTASSG